MSSGDQMNQGYQSEFLTYVKRTQGASLSPGSGARTTSSYGRQLSTTVIDRRAGFVEFAPAARKFPDESPLNNACTVVGAKQKVSGKSAAVGVDSSRGATEEQTKELSSGAESNGGATANTPLDLSVGKSRYSVPSLAFYGRKPSTESDASNMKDRELVTEMASIRGSSEIDSERNRSRRNSPAASLNGDDTRGRKVVASAAANGTNSNSSSTSSISSNNSTLVHMLRSGPATRLPPPFNIPHYGQLSSSRPTPNTSSDESSQNQIRLGTGALRTDNDDSRGSLSGDKALDRPRKRGESTTAPRPKRHIIPKNMEMGLSWREQNDLKKALQASLQESKRPGEDGLMENGAPGEKRRSAGSKYWVNLMLDDSSQESSRSGVSSESSSAGLLKVRAQRKFATGSRPSSPGTTPVKPKNSPRKFFTTKKAKTEDFLTFLCLRGSHMLPPHLDFSKIDDSEDCFQSSCPNTPRSSRPGTPAMAGLGVRDITPRGGRVVGGSRSTTPDRDISLDDNDLGCRPLPNDVGSTSGSPTKKVIVISPSSSPSKSQLGKRKSTGKVEEQITGEKKSRSQESSPRKKDKDKNRKKKKSHDAEGADGKSKKKKKRRKEETKMLRRKLVMRACSTVVKASKRKLKLANEKVNQRSLRGDTGGAAVGKPVQHLESITSILEGLTTKRSVGRPRKGDISEKSGEKTPMGRKATEQPQGPNLTRTRSPETRASTRANSRSVSPYKSPNQTRTPSRESERQSVTSESSERSSRKDRTPSSAAKDKHKLQQQQQQQQKMLLKKVTRSEARLHDATHRDISDPNHEDIPSIGPSNPEPMYRTRSLPMLPAGAPQPEATSQKMATAVRRVVSSVTKSVKKMASAAPAMPTPTPIPEKKGRGRPAGSGKKSANISILKMSFRAPFPSPSDPGQIVEIPTYHPSSEQFQDPISYIQSIRADAEPFGMCRIVPPDGWKPECKFPDDLKFVTQMQYIHRMRNRWGPNSLATESIRRHLQSQGIKLEQAPMVGGVELDLPALSETLQHYGGMQSVLDKNKWPKVIESLRIPKIAPERCSKLYDSYCKFLLSYDTLPAEEKAQLEQNVLADKEKGQLTTHDDCVCKGRVRHLSDFFRHSRNIESVWFKKEPSVEEVEELYWKMVEGGEHHVAVQSAEVDTKVCGSGFPTKKDSPYSRHGWNLNILQHNSGSVLRCLGPVSGVTVPALHVGMTFSTKCWSANDHLLPQVVYKHTGADTVWYCLPASEESKFHSVCRKLVPEHADDDPVWLLDDTLMISPEKLIENGVSLGRTTLSPGQFLFVFPEAFTSSVSCGYNLSESLHFATADWIPIGAKAAQMLHDSGVPEQFSMDRLLFKLARYEKTPLETLEHVLPQLEQVVEREMRERQELEEAGLTAAERMCAFDDDVVMTSSKKRHKYENTESDDNVCDISKKICYLSMVLNEAEDTVYSLEHALNHVQKKRNLKVCKLLYRYTIDELNSILKIVTSRLAGKEPESFGPPARKKAK